MHPVIHQLKVTKNSFNVRTARLSNNSAILSLVGGHLGRGKTYQKIAGSFYQKTLWIDVNDHVQQCETCQTTNDAISVKATAPLHPIPVRFKVWNQVIEVSCMHLPLSLRNRLLYGSLYVPTHQLQN